MPPEIKIAAQIMEIIEPSSVLKGIQTKAVPGSPLALLMGETKKRGYQPATGPKNVLGFRQTWKADQEVKPPRGVTAEPVKEVSFELHIQDFIKPSSKDILAIGAVTLKAGKNIDTYHMLLEAPGGDLAKVREYYVNEGKVVLAHSWWTAWYNCLKTDCWSVCKSALDTCPLTSWSAFWACVIRKIQCASCALRCAACATCNCKWYCKKVVGCCKQ